MPSHDVLIIGAGLAGQRAALAAARAGASVAVMSKVHPVRSHSVAAAGGINAAISVADDWRSHAYDTVKGSDFLGDQDAIEVMCAEAPHEVMHLEHIGVTFHRNDEGELDLRAFGGASLKDMEMVQYHPTTLVDSGILITEGARGEGAHLLNADGERFMEKSAPNKMELASRDVVSRAEQIEINEGRGVGPGGQGVYLDVTVGPRKPTLEALREIVNLGKDFAGVDITREPIAIRPGQHYIMGGVKTDIEGRTPIEGLYAAGEVACVSVHGGNRLGANSLLDTLIFGRRAGEHAAARASAMAMPSLDSKPHMRREEERIEGIIARPREGRRVSEIKHELGELMDREAAVFRSEEGLRRAQETIARLKEEAEQAWIDDRGTVFNQDVLGAIELGFMVDCAEATVLAALERTESRGAQFRTDFPARNDDEWLKHIDISLNGDGPEVSYSPVTITQWQPEERTY